MSLATNAVSAVNTVSFYGVTDIASYVAGAFGIILLPGPNSLYVLSVATARGVRAGYQGAFGVFLGDTILLILVALGAASLLRSNPTLFMVVKYAGAAYLAWVGLNLLWAAIQKWRSAATPLPELSETPEVSAEVSKTAAQNTSTPASPATPANMQHPFRRALLISLLNPKAILFLLSFFIQFIDPSYPTPAVPFLILSSIVMFFSAVYLSTLIFVGARLAQAFRSRAYLSATLSGAVGGLFLWFGSKLANASLG